MKTLPLFGLSDFFAKKHFSCQINCFQTRIDNSELTILFAQGTKVLVVVSEIFCLLYFMSKQQ